MLTRPAPIEANGRTSRGNQTFWTSARFSISERAAACTLPAKKFQMRRPDNMKIPNNSTRVGRKTVKTNEKTTRYIAGFSSDQKNPRTSPCNAHVARAEPGG